jgi:hypothetical protein
MTNSLSFESTRPSKPHSSQSFSRYEAPRVGTPTRSRASTLQNELSPSFSNLEKTKSAELLAGSSKREDDIFEKRSAEDGKDVSKDSGSSPVADGLPAGFDELPIELISLADR